MNKLTPEAYLQLIQNAANTKLSDAADALCEFAGKYAPLTELEFKSAFIKTGVTLAFNQTDIEQREQSYQKLRTEIDKLAHEIIGFNEKRKQSGQDTNTPAVAETAVRSYLGNKKIVISCKDLVKHFSSENFTLGTVSFDFRLGEITGLVGLNSHGKSTLLRLIAKRLKPDSGTVTYSNAGQEEGQPLAGGYPALRVGYLPQELPYEFGSVKNNLHLTASLAGLYKQKNEREVQYALYRLGLFDKANTKISLLSGGFKLRYALAKLLVAQPDVLILDEPLANLDFKAQSNFLTDLYALARNNNKPISIIITSQHIEEVETVADNMMVLKNGQLVYAGKTNQVYADQGDNLYEIRCKLDFGELKHRLKDLDYNSITEESFFTFIYTPGYVTRDVFLDYCHQHQIDITFFNDMGRSVKRLILENTAL